MEIVLSHITPAKTFTATYDNQDRLLGYGEVTYSYTADGELKQKSNTTTNTTTPYVYDVVGNLLEVTTLGTNRINYLVDGNNRRIGKSMNDVLFKGYLYKDGLNPVAELDATGALLSRFVYGTREEVPDYMTREGQTFRLVSDHLGSVRLVIDSNSGTILQRLEYDEFGQIVEDTNEGFQPFGFAGGLYEPLTGLIRFGARDYDPEIGRWTTRDPIRFRGGQTNLYVYANNDPVNLIDPTGTGESGIWDWVWSPWDTYQKYKKKRDKAEKIKKFIEALERFGRDENDKTISEVEKAAQHLRNLGDNLDLLPLPPGAADLYKRAIDAGLNCGLRNVKIYINRPRNYFNRIRRDLPEGQFNF